MKWLKMLIFVLLLSLCNSPIFAGYGKKLCLESPYFCYKVKRGDTWDNVFGDKQDLIKRINRINIRLHSGMVIAVPKNLDALSDSDLLEFSPFPRHIDPPGEKVIYVRLGALAWAAYDADGRQQFWGPISGGQGYCSDVGRRCGTPSGTFHIYQKQGRGCSSSKFPIGRGGAPMPYCMFFHGGFAMHGSYDVPGYHASHGCVRMFVGDAEWLNKEFVGSERNIPVIIRQ